MSGDQSRCQCDVSWKREIEQVFGEFAEADGIERRNREKVARFYADVFDPVVAEFATVGAGEHYTVEVTKHSDFTRMVYLRRQDKSSLLTLTFTASPTSSGITLTAIGGLGTDNLTRDRPFSEISKACLAGYLLEKMRAARANM